MFRRVVANIAYFDIYLENVPEIPYPAIGGNFLSCIFQLLFHGKIGIILVLQIRPFLDISN